MRALCLAQIHAVARARRAKSGFREGENERQRLVLVARTKCEVGHCISQLFQHILASAVKYMPTSCDDDQ